MHRRVKGLLVVAVVLSVIGFLSGSAKAEATDEVVQDLVDIGISADAANELVGGPTDTLGERTAAMVENGTISKEQYKRMSETFANYPQEKRQALKNFYDEGGAPKIADLTTAGLHRKMNPDDTSLRGHAKDLKQQGLTREEIKKKLEAQGYDPSKVNDWTQGEANRRDHMRDAREEGLSRDQAREKARERYETDHAKDRKDLMKSEGDRRGHMRDKEHRQESVRQRSKESRDVRKGNRYGHDRGVRDRGAGRGRAGRGRGGLRRR